MSSHKSEDEGESSLFLDPSRHSIDSTNTGFKWRRLALASFVLNALLLCTVILVSIQLFSIKQTTQCLASSGTKHHDGEINGELKRVSSYSPLLDEIDLRLHSQRFNGRIHDNTSIFRQDPSPDVDAAWDELAAEGIEIITVSEEAVILSGKTPGLSIKAPDSWGRGPQAYVAQVDVFHQIHCLNELRKEINFDYYYGKDSRLNHTSLPADHREHKKHCIHMLLQNLMCHADVGIVTHNWVHYEVPDQPNRPYAEPFADFNVIKKCRNFDALLEWAQANTVKDLSKRWAELKMPGGAEFVSGDGYW